LIAKGLVMSERHQVRLVKIEIFEVSPASPVNLSPASLKPVTKITSRIYSTEYIDRELRTTPI